ncbi:hypothetical protein Q4603_05805 [Zobellia galactanivorans]|uniref:hypothetical protein n=1 Tax=Zobellia galactanivorans (strain DSM 12802 / CCUG 47099 / CIP 106680 / NCIMB 13871 / Dsij) TaxID=63186 RepID=UPI0026E17F22|nr:hypothetical protein [Zobellia galactanivorans]MDO6808110.1 hypothetical protein [Zobellia galactanivorans]
MAASCAPVENPYLNYCEMQIVDKESTATGRWFRFRTDEGITDRVYVLEIDYDAYEVGDYLNCN